MAAVTSYELQRHFGEIFDRVLRGEAVEITRFGRPAMRVTRIEPEEPPKEKQA